MQKRIGALGSTLADAKANVGLLSSFHRYPTQRHIPLSPQTPLAVLNKFMCLDIRHKCAERQSWITRGIVANCVDCVLPIVSTFPGPACKQLGSNVRKVHVQCICERAKEPLGLSHAYLCGVHRPWDNKYSLHCFRYRRSSCRRPPARVRADISTRRVSCICC